MIYLIGAGGHAGVVLDALILLGYRVQPLERDSSLVGQEILGHRIEQEEGILSGLKGPVEFFVGIGHGPSRRRVAGQWEARGHRLARVIHPGAIVSPHARVEPGAAVMAGAVVQARAVIGKGAIINTGATVDHDCRIGEFAHIAPGSHLAGNVQVGEEAWVGIGSAVREGLVIGAGTVVGAGAVVLKDLPPAVVAYGNPCRVVRPIGSDE